MNKGLLLVDFLLVVFVLEAVGARISRVVIDDSMDDDEEDIPQWSRCPFIRNKLKNGRVKLRSRGRIAKFMCDPGYELAGKRFTTCVRGQWNNPIPVCVSRGCSRPPVVPNARVSEMYRGAVLLYECLPGYSMQGGATVYCDGRQWSSEAPMCEMSTTNPLLICDFEDPNLCGWSHDPTHDFDWKRNQFATPSGHVGTGPTADHTFGTGKGGFYLYMEASSPRKVNDTARLFSPVYPNEYSGGCFVFWYHMFGSTTGGLRVYIRPESHVFGELLPVWSEYGDQGNRWIRGNVTIPPFNEHFQIVIEGIRGSSYIGDTAIDDVSLNPEDCSNIGNITDHASEFVSSSCRGRCREALNETYTCGCNDGCTASTSGIPCCDDFFELCTKSSDGTENPEEQSVSITTPKHVTIQTSPNPDSSSSLETTTPVTSTLLSLSSTNINAMQTTTSSNTPSSSDTSSSTSPTPIFSVSTNPVNTSSSTTTGILSTTSARPSLTSTISFTTKLTPTSLTTAKSMPTSTSFTVSTRPVSTTSRFKYGTATPTRSVSTTPRFKYGTPTATRSLTTSIMAFTTSTTQFTIPTTSLATSTKLFTSPTALSTTATALSTTATALSTTSAKPSTTSTKSTITSTTPTKTSPSTFTSLLTPSTTKSPNISTLASTIPIHHFTNAITHFYPSSTALTTPSTPRTSVIVSTSKSTMSIIQTTPSNIPRTSSNIYSSTNINPVSTTKSSTSVPILYRLSTITTAKNTMSTKLPPLAMTSTVKSTSAHSPTIRTTTIRTVPTYSKSVPTTTRATTRYIYRFTAEEITRRTYNLRPRYGTTPIPFTRIYNTPPTRWYHRYTRSTTRMRFPSTTITTPTTPLMTSTKLVSTTTSTSTTSTTFVSKESQHSSTSASTASDNKSTVTIVSVVLISAVCITGGLIFYFRRWKARWQSKLADDSEMRFLYESEFAEFSDASALEKMNFNHPLI